MKTNQELFNTAYTRHVINQEHLGFIDAVGGVFCSYVMKCAVGCNLTQTELSLIEDRREDQARVTTIDLRGISSFGPGNIDFLCDLQVAHDSAADYFGIEYMLDIFNKDTYNIFDSRLKAVKYNYELVAEFYNLTVP